MSDSSLSCQWKGCSVQCQSTGELKNHLEKVHIGTRKSSYSCEWSGCQFGNRKKIYDLKTHIAIHHRHLSYECIACNQMFSRDQELRKHYKKCKLFATFNQSSSSSTPESEEDILKYLESPQSSSLSPQMISYPNSPFHLFAQQVFEEEQERERERAEKEEDDDEESSPNDNITLSQTKRLYSDYGNNNTTSSKSMKYSWYQSASSSSSSSSSPYSPFSSPKPSTMSQTNVSSSPSPSSPSPSPSPTPSYQDSTVSSPSSSSSPQSNSEFFDLFNLDSNSDDWSQWGVSSNLTPLRRTSNQPIGKVPYQFIKSSPFSNVSQHVNTQSLRIKPNYITKMFKSMKL